VRKLGGKPFLSIGMAAKRQGPSSCNVFVSSGCKGVHAG
jgi:hypothetical protein